MAYLEWNLRGDVHELARHIDRVITGGSITAKLEARSERVVGDARMIVLAFERYSMIGGNRLGLTFSLLAVGQEIAATAVTAGGSEALFFKINTFGEEAFLAHAERAFSSFNPGG